MRGLLRRRAGNRGRARRTDVQDSTACLAASLRPPGAGAEHPRGRCDEVPQTGLTERRSGVCCAVTDPVSQLEEILRNAYRLAAAEARTSRGLMPPSPGPARRA